MDCKTAILLKRIDKVFPGSFACISTEAWKHRDGRIDVEYALSITTDSKMYNQSFSAWRLLEAHVNLITGTMTADSLLARNGI